MSVLVATHHQFEVHDTGRGHPERPERLAAVKAGLEHSEVRDALKWFEPSPAPREAVTAVHPGRYLLALEEHTAAGGGWLDGDTAAHEGSYEAAMLAAGAGLDAVDRLRAGEASSAFCAVRPPGHHATPHRPMGFCLINNLAVTARRLADEGEKVLVVDYDAHHGNGTQDAFYDDDRVVYVSLHESPLYPGTGTPEEMGGGAGCGATLNVPLPAGATGDVARSVLDELVAPLVDRWRPDWLLVSAGYDAHRRDPLTGLGLSSGDFADLTRDLGEYVPSGRTILFLEGGYDLEALRDSAAATVAGLLGEVVHPERPTAGGPGRDSVDDLLRRRRILGFDEWPART